MTHYFRIHQSCYLHEKNRLNRCLFEFNKPFHINCAYLSKDSTLFSFSLLNTWSFAELESSCIYEICRYSIYQNTLSCSYSRHDLCYHKSRRLIPLLQCISSQKAPCHVVLRISSSLLCSLRGSPEMLSCGFW